jgi:AmmeMemoRadiSam system protein A
MLTTEEKKTLLTLARNTIEQYITKGMIVRFETDDPVLKQPCGVFVTLHNKESLRGCIGIIECDQPLYQMIVEMAIESATSDPRFVPVNEYELKEINIEISVLFGKRRVESADDIEIGKHGVIVKRGFASGVFLPQVAHETGWSKREFMEHLCEQKAGLAKDAYLDKKTELYVFEAEVFNEKEMNEK